MRCRRFAIPALVAVAVAQAAVVASPARAATVRYASPAGAGTSCLATAPCSLVTAVNAASPGAEVVVASGTYPLAASLGRDVGGLNIHGVPGQPRPVLLSSAARAVDIGQAGAGTRVSDLTIVHSGTEYGLNVFAKSTVITRVSVRSTGAVACSPGISGLMRDSLCVTSAAGGIAVDDSWGSDAGQLALRNVTAVATGPGSYGIRADASGKRTLLVVDARNVIASGTAADVRSTEEGEKSESIVGLRTSNFDTVEVLNGGWVSPIGTGGNQTAAPRYLETTTYRQAPGSPTIDGGSGSAENGPADLDGDPRVTGAAPDIGVDELDVTAPDTRILKGPKRGLHKPRTSFAFGATEAATFSCQVDRRKAEPCASPYRVKVRRHGHHRIRVTARDEVGNLDPTPATYRWTYKRKKRR